MRILDVTVIPSYEGYNRASEVARRIKAHLRRLDTIYKATFVVRVTVDEEDDDPLSKEDDDR